jgi:hypothetical protein
MNLAMLCSAVKGSHAIWAFVVDSNPGSSICQSLEELENYMKNALLTSASVELSLIETNWPIRYTIL